MDQAMTRPLKQATEQTQRRGQPAAYPPGRHSQPLYPPNYTQATSAGASTVGQGFILGLVGGAVGVLAMDLFRQYVSPLIMPDENGQGANGNTRGGQGGTEGQDDSISLVGQHHRPDESSTAALGRMMYSAVEHHDPDKATKSELSNLVHWGYGILQGGVYGVMQPVLGDNALLGGVLFGTGLWLLGDELAVPLLGLQDGPAAAPTTTHLNRLALHLAYGVTTAAATQLLNRIT